MDCRAGRVVDRTRFDISTDELTWPMKNAPSPLFAVAPADAKIWQSAFAMTSFAAAHSEYSIRHRKDRTQP